MLGSDALRQAHLPIQQGGLGLTNSAAVAGAAGIGCQTLALGGVLTMASTRGSLALLEHLSGRSLAKEPIAALKEITRDYHGRAAGGQIQWAPPRQRSPQVRKWKRRGWAICCQM